MVAERAAALRDVAPDYERREDRAPCGCEVTVHIMRVVRHRLECEFRCGGAPRVLEYDWEAHAQQAID